MKKSIKINVSSGGRLRKALKALNTDLAAITSLTISGIIDVRDFKILREMKLAKVDISAVRIVQYKNKDIIYHADEIPKKAFNFTKIRQITLPDTVKFIDNDAFSGCSELRTITLPSSLVCIGEYTFFSCSKLTAIVLPPLVESIGEWAFYWCCNLKTVTFHSGLKYISANAFIGCSNLTEINFPDSLISISESAFSGCKKLNSSFDLSSVYHIEDFSFSHSGLTAVTISSSIRYLGDGAFSGCESLKSITVLEKSADNRRDTRRHNISKPASDRFPDDYHSGCFSRDGVLFRKLKSKLIKLVAYPADKGMGHYEIPSWVSIIGDRAFSNAKLTSVTIPSSVKYIGASAFIKSKLTTIELPLSVTQIESSTFEDCRNLTSVTIPLSITHIEDKAFVECTKLRILTIPPSVTYLSPIVTNGYTRIEVDENNMDYSSMYGILFNKQKTAILKYPYRRIAVRYSIPETVTHIGDGAFEGYFDYKKIKAKGRYINTDIAFQGCKLSSIHIPPSVIHIGNEAFYGCSRLKTITIPSSVVDMGQSVFRKCTGLTSVNIQSTLITEIPQSAFSDCDHLISINIPSSVIHISSESFKGCCRLASITIPPSVTNIWANVFEGCSQLKDVCIMSHLQQYQFTTELPVISLSKKLPCSAFQGHKLYYAYAFTADMTSVMRAKIIREIKFNDKLIHSTMFDDFIGNAVLKLDEAIGLKNYSLLVHPQSSTPVNDMMIRHILSIADMKSMKLPKLNPPDIEFDNVAFERTELTRRHPDGQFVYVSHAREQLQKNIRMMMHRIHHSDYFSIARSVKYKYRPYIKPFLTFADENQSLRYAKHKGNILLIDDVTTSGATLNAALNVLTPLIGSRAICIFTLIGKDF